MAGYPNYLLADETLPGALSMLSNKVRYLFADEKGWHFHSFTHAYYSNVVATLAINLDLKERGSFAILDIPWPLKLAALDLLLHVESLLVINKAQLTSRRPVTYRNLEYQLESETLSATPSGSPDLIHDYQGWREARYMSDRIAYQATLTRIWRRRFAMRRVQHVIGYSRRG
jgi:hypothetical protein